MMRSVNRTAGTYNFIREIKGSLSGCCDVMVGKDERVVFLEYKGPKDKPNQNELSCIDSARSASISEKALSS